MRSEPKIRFGVVGLGWFAQAAILPGFSNAENSELVALFSGDAEKREEMSRRYGARAYSYEDYEKVLADGDLDAVYIATPNSEHCEQVLLAAKHGVHVLCEKPLSHSSEECLQMIEACRNHAVKLMTAYRLHFEQMHTTTIEIIQNGVIGRPRIIESVFTQSVEEGNTRLDADLGGGPLLDMGIYSINAARYLFRAEPVEVVGFAAHSSDPRFREVPETISALLRFPEDRLAMITAGFGQSKVSSLRVVGTQGDVRLDPAFGHDSDLKRFVTVQGKTRTEEFAARDHIGPEILYFANCIQNDRTPEPDGAEGLRDVEIIEAIHESIRLRRPVLRELDSSPRRPSVAQMINKPKIAKPPLVKAEAPQG